jgi:hypothetical protein
MIVVAGEVDIRSIVRAGASTFTISFSARVVGFGANLKKLPAESTLVLALLE